MAREVPDAQIENMVAVVELDGEAPPSASPAEAAQVARAKRRAVSKRHPAR